MEIRPIFAFRRTIFQALADKLGRNPTNVELKAEVQRILYEALVEGAEKGKLSFQRKARSRVHLK